MVNKLGRVVTYLAGLPTTKSHPYFQKSPDTLNMLYLTTKRLMTNKLGTVVT